MKEGSHLTIVSIHQPAYLPWLGYFDRIKKVDIFVFLDTVQFEKGSFINRNKIKTANGYAWLTVPVKSKGYMQSTVGDILIDHSQDWRRKHLSKIYHAYKDSPGFEEKYQKLGDLYLGGLYLNLSSMCYHHLVFWLKELGISTRVCKASDISVRLGKKSDLNLDICKYLGADYYLSGPFGRQYLDEESFRKEKIKVIYHDFQHPVYPQLWGEFIPNMGVVDYWMNKEG